MSVVGSSPPLQRPPGVPRRQQHGARIGGLLDQVRNDLGRGRVIGQRGSFPNSFPQRPAKNPEHHGDND